MEREHHNEALHRTVTLAHRTHALGLLDTGSRGAHTESLVHAIVYVGDQIARVAEAREAANEEKA